MKRSHYVTDVIKILKKDAQLKSGYKLYKFYQVALHHFNQSLGKLMRLLLLGVKGSFKVKFTNNTHKYTIFAMQ